MRNIKLILEYDGSKFFGFQRQPHHPTIQEELERALASFFNREMKISSASGRTDTGVHAEFQAVNFKTNSGRSLEQIQKGLNALLPESISVKKIEETSLDFHARYGAKSKSYEYLVWNHPERSPLKASRSYHVPFPLELAKMRGAAKMLEGRHDFRSFCASSTGKPKENTVRTVKQLKITNQGPLICFRIEADGFLYHMVRNIVGTLIEIGAGRFDLKQLREILHARDRRRAGRTAPAAGLTLVDVRY